MRLPLPQVEPDPTLPGSVTIYEVGPRDGLQNESARRADRGQGRVRPPAGRRRAADRRGDQLRRTRSGCPSSPTPRSCSTLLGDRRASDAQLPGAGAQRARPRPGPRARRRRTSRSSAAPPRPSRSKNLNRSLDEQFAMFEPTVRARAGRRAATSGPTCRCASATRGRAPVPDRPGRRRRQAALRPRRQPAQPRRHDRRRHRRPRHRPARRVRRRRASATDQLAVHFHDTYGQALANTYCRAAGRDHHVRRQRRRARRLPLRQVGHRQPRHRGPGLDAAPASASSTGVDLDAAGRDQRVDGRAARADPSPSTRGAGARRRLTEAATAVPAVTVTPAGWPLISQARLGCEFRYESRQGGATRAGAADHDP